MVGGTGLYFMVLTEGLAPLPPVPAGLRARGEALLERLGLARFAADLAARDPETTSAIDLANPRRVLRAWEVLEHTGRPLARWKAETGPPPLPEGRATRIVLAPPRDWLAGRVRARLDAMVADGALDEVAALLRLDPARDSPAWRALGARELADHLEGRLPLGDAIARAATQTRRYAKRQLTWARGRMPDWTVIGETDPATRLDRALAIHGAGAREPG